MMGLQDGSTENSNVDAQSGHNAPYGQNGDNVTLKCMQEKQMDGCDGVVSLVTYSSYTPLQ